MKTINLLTFLPLFVFMLVARLHGMTELAWQEAFMLSGLCAIVIVTIQMYQKLIIDRLMLGVNLFLTLGAVAFLVNIDSLLYYYGAYKGVAFLSCIAVVGIVTSLFSDSVFVGISSHNKKLINEVSLQLLAVNAAAIAWSFVMNSDGLIISVVVPYVALRVIYERLGKEVAKAK